MTDPSAEVMEAVEGLRRALNALPRFSFHADGKSGVARVPDRYGRWIEWQAAHELFDAEVVAAKVALERARKAIDKAGKEWP